MITHPYSPDSSAVDRTDGEPVACVVCGLPLANRVHQVDEERVEQVALVDARKLGEGAPDGGQ